MIDINAQKVKEIDRLKTTKDYIKTIKICHTLLLIVQTTLLR